jgi:hypothetical protein
LKPEQIEMFNAYLLAPPPDAVHRAAARSAVASQDAAAIEEFNAAEG